MVTMPMREYKVEGEIYQVFKTSWRDPSTRPAATLSLIILQSLMFLREGGMDGSKYLA